MRKTSNRQRSGRLGSHEGSIRNEPTDRSDGQRVRKAIVGCSEETRFREAKPKAPYEKEVIDRKLL
ncbi:uncharacterized protein LY79DRAFT_570381 [Colletotrichum navitas]|uniref:Uncharacterized protein n=1 Tax=Colletotrichum navitas TaxID=681940 RepID=A0AAD8PLV4_9PEZI|nr:uncharacterized protein LY79DRAFT_570381 [Colletotrichum navitas]KAK1570149.1 hypothetical protein LY79DRAFT_570381 [Colletotrichum navitas]